jgi:hypothetical protein
MSAKPTLAKLESHAASPQQFYVYPFLKNEGTSTLQPGRLILKQTSKDGTVGGGSAQTALIVIAIAIILMYLL